MENDDLSGYENLEPLLEEVAGKAIVITPEQRQFQLERLEYWDKRILELNENIDIEITRRKLQDEYNTRTFKELSS